MPKLYDGSKILQAKNGRYYIKDKNSGKPRFISNVIAKNHGYKIGGTIKKVTVTKDNKKRNLALQRLDKLKEKHRGQLQKHIEKSGGALTWKDVGKVAKKGLGTYVRYALPAAAGVGATLLTENPMVGIAAGGAAAGLAKEAADYVGLGFKDKEKKKVKKVKRKKSTVYKKVGKCDEM